MAICAVNGLSLCSGIGGLDLGVGLALDGYRTVCHVEREAFAAAALVARMEDETLHSAPIWDDLATFDGRPWRGVVDMVIAGFPCQPWSVAGKRAQTDDARWLWPHVARIIRDVGPSVVFVENVGGFLRGGVEHVLRDLAEMGFAAEWGVLGANDAGLPHQRRRFFLLAYAASEGSPIRGVGGRTAPHGEIFDMHPADCRDTLANANRRSDADAEWGASARNGLEQTGEISLADADRAQCQGHGSACGVRATFAGIIGDLPLAPPGPDDRDGWAAIAHRAPGAQPVLCRVADGAATGMERPELRYRADRLRALGNAVAPIQAATSLAVLWRRLGLPDGCLIL